MSFSAKELFEGTANYYSKYRIQYPKPLLDLILDFYKVNGNGKLLDLGCGTGQLAIPLHENFKEVIGVDISQDMINEAIKLSEAQNAETIRFITMESEKINNELGQFDLIVCGNAFHWMDKAMALERSYDVLNALGGMVILAGGSIWSGKDRWQKEVLKVIKKWLGEKRKAGKGDYSSMEKSFEDYIDGSKFQLENTGTYKFMYKWTIESLIGYLYSTSYCNRVLLGEHIEEFENEIKETLLTINPKGVFEEEVVITYFFLKK